MTLTFLGTRGNIDVRTRRHRGVAQLRQLARGVRRRMTGWACAVSDDLGILAGDELRCKFLDAIRQRVPGARQMGMCADLSSTNVISARRTPRSSTFAGAIGHAQPRDTVTRYTVSLDIRLVRS